MIIHFDPAARRELEAAVEWYDHELEGLGNRFGSAVKDTIDRIIRYPLWGTEIKRGVYRTLVSKFPYAVIYGYDEVTLTIYAVMHLHRNPGYWRHRLS